MWLYCQECALDATIWILPEIEPDDLIFITYVPYDIVDIMADDTLYGDARTRGISCQSDDPILPE